MSKDQEIIELVPTVEIKEAPVAKKPLSTILLSAITSVIIGGITSTAVFYTLSMMNTGEKQAELQRLTGIEMGAASTQKALEAQIQGLNQKLAMVENNAKAQVSALEKKLETLSISGVSTEVKQDLERLKLDSSATKSLSDKLSMLDSKQNEMGLVAQKTLIFNAGQQLLAKLETSESFADELAALERLSKDLTQDGVFSLAAKKGFISNAQLLTAYLALKPVKNDAPVQKTWFEEKLAPLTHLIKVKRKDDVVKLEMPALEKALIAGNVKQALALWQQQPESFRKTYMEFDTNLIQANQQFVAKQALKTKVAEVLK